MANPTPPSPLLLLLVLLLHASTLLAAVRSPSSSTSTTAPAHHRKLEGGFASFFRRGFSNTSISGGGGGRRSKNLLMAEEFLRAHNRVREAEGEAPLAWDKALAEFAGDWARSRRDDCSIVHSEGPYGENMFWGTGKEWTATDAVEIWAAEEENYDRESNTCGEGKVCGHYTQIVWKSTARLGCARVRCSPGDGVVIVCNYDPPGNWANESPFDCN